MTRSDHRSDEVGPSQITFVASAANPALVLPFRQGRSLCSVRDPFKEATGWAQRAILTSRHVFVLGHGAGFHVQQLKNMAGARSVVSVDFDAELNPDLILSVGASAETIWSQLIAPVLEAGFQVLSFRPAWAGVENEFQRLEDFILGRGTTVGETIAWLQCDPGLRSWLQHADPSFYQSLKSIVPEPILPPLSERQKILLALRELIE